MEETEKILNVIEKVVDKLNFYVKYQEVELTEKDKENIQTAYLMLFPGKAYTYTSACGQCVKEAINVLESYYQREKPLFEAKVKEDITQVPLKMVKEKMIVNKKNTLEKK